MTTIYVLLIVWAGAGPLEKTHMVYGSMAYCEEALARFLVETPAQATKATCTARRVKRGEPVEISEGLEFVPY